LYPKRCSRSYLVGCVSWPTANSSFNLLNYSADGPLKNVILVVEDEAIIRMGTVQLLEDAGYTALEASNADVAIKILESRADINVVLTDIKMPGSLCGLRLARAVRNRWPPIHLIVTSGLKAPTEQEFPGIWRFIRKPYGPKHILKALGELFGPDPEPYHYINDVIQNYARVA